MGFLKSIKKIIFKRADPKRFWSLRQKAQSKSKIKRYLYGYLYMRYLSKYNASIPTQAAIQGMPVFPHGLNGIFISQGAVIGKNCVIFHQVTIGSNTLPDSKGQGSPTIGDDVYIGAGAKIIGKVVVGNHVRIGANCVVTKDVPDNTTVVPAPVRYITKDQTMNNQFTPYQEWFESQEQQ